MTEPNFIMRDPELITKQLVQRFEEISGRTLEPAQAERLEIDLIAYRENLLRENIQWVGKQNLVDFAIGGNLDNLGVLVGAERLPAQSATTTIRFSLSEARESIVNIPLGTAVKTKDSKYIFKTASQSYIPIGETTIDIEAECETPGEGGNGYLSGEINQIVTPVPYVISGVNVTTSANGAEIETDNNYRERIKLAPESFSNAGSAGAYIYWTKTFSQNIIDVAIESPSPGVVNVYPLTVNGNPDNSMLTGIYSLLHQDRIRPLTDQVNVISPTSVNYSISADITLYNWADLSSVQTAINTKLAEYIANQKSKLGLDLVPSQIIALLNSVYGVYKVDLITPEFHELGYNEWGNCTSQEIDYVGYVNG